MRICVLEEPSVTVHTCLKQATGTWWIFHTSKLTGELPKLPAGKIHYRFQLKVGQTDTAHILRKHPTRMRRSRKHFHSPKRSLQEWKISHFCGWQPFCGRRHPSCSGTLGVRCSIPTLKTSADLLSSAKPAKHTNKEDRGCRKFSVLSKEWLCPCPK